MALDASGYIIKPMDFSALERMAERKDRNQQRAAQLAEQQQGKKNASANFLRQQLDPKDYLTGTAADPMIGQGLTDLLSQGSTMAANGVDNPTITMALASGIGKIINYSNRAKGVRKNVEDQITKLKDSGEVGFDLAKLQDMALNNAFYDVDEKGKKVLNVDKADPAKNWVQDVIDRTPEDVTTSEALDEFAKKSPMQSLDDEVRTYDKFGNMNREKMRLIGQNWLTPERDATGRPTSLVPKYDLATEEGKPVMEDYTDDKGNPMQRQVRLLKEDVFDQMMSSKKSTNAFMRGQINKAVKENERITGNKIDPDSPNAKRLAQQVAWKELDRRKNQSIQSISEVDRPSGAQASMNVQGTPQYRANVEANAAAAKEGRNSVPSQDEQDKANKTNIFQAFGGIAGNNPDYNSGPRTQIKGRNVIDVTGSLPGGGIKKGPGQDDTYKKIYWDPGNREFHFDMETKDKNGAKKREIVTKTEAEMGPFLMSIAEANGIRANEVREWLDKIGYKNGKFTKIESNNLAEELKALPDTKEKDAIERVRTKGGVDFMNNKFKGKSIGDQEIVGFEGDYGINGNNYRVKLKGPDGKVTTKKLKTKADVARFLEGEEQKAAPATAPPATGPYGQDVNRNGKLYTWDKTKGKYVIKQ